MAKQRSELDRIREMIRDLEPSEAQRLKRLLVQDEELIVRSFKVPKKVSDAFDKAVKAKPGLRIQEAVTEALSDWVKKQ